MRRDLIADLRRSAHNFYNNRSQLLLEAADELERLNAELERLDPQTEGESKWHARSSP